MLYRKHNYLNKEIKFIRSGNIIEYDMRNAGLEILNKNGIIKDNYYEELMELEKKERSIVIGKFLRTNPLANEFLIKSFISIRKEFIEINNIDNNDILSIKKDAIFLIDKEVYNLDLEKGYKFIKKNDYQTYINLMNIEFYYNIFEDILDVKGMKSKSKEIHEDYLLKDLKKILFLSYNNDLDNIFIYLAKLKDKYVRKELDIHYYFDINKSNYVMQLMDILYYISEEEIEKEYLNDLLITTNLHFLNEICNQVFK